MVHGRVIQRPWQHLEVQKVVPPGLWDFEGDLLARNPYHTAVQKKSSQWKWQAQKFKNSKLKMAEHFWKTWKLVPIIIFVYLRSWKSQLKGGVSPNRESVPGKIGLWFPVNDKILAIMMKILLMVQKSGCCTGLWYMTLFQERAPYSSRQLVLAVISLPVYYLWSEWWGDESIEFFSSENGCSIHYKETVVRMRWPSTLLRDFPVVRMRWSTVLSGSVTSVATGSFGFIRVWRSDHV